MQQNCKRYRDRQARWSELQEQPPFRKTEMDQAPRSRKSNDSDMTEISQIISEVEEIENT